MKFESDRHIYQQISDDIFNKILKGTLPIGSKLQSIKELAIEYRVNPNTICKSIDELEKNSIVIKKRGIGTFITEDKNLINSEKKQYALRLTNKFISDLQQAGFNKDDIEEVMRYILNESGN